MPSYNFEILNKRTGDTLAVVPVALPVEDRDAVGIRRRTVPERVSIAGSAPDPFDQAGQVLRGYRRKEEREGSRFQSEFSKQEIKRAWSTPDP